MDTYWQSQFRRRMDDFGRDRIEGFEPVSIKVRVTSGCFHREHSPHAYTMIHDYLVTADLSDIHCQFEEHESGPEILVYVAAGLAFTKSIIDLVTAIIKARSEGIKKGDKPSDPLEVIVRGHLKKDGEYFEETILRIPHDKAITPKLIADALAKKKSKTPARKKPKKK